MYPLTQWLDGPKDYLEGVRLYLRYGKDDRLKMLFTAEMETDFKRKKLEDAIRNLIKQQPSQAPITPQPVQVILQPDQDKSWTLESCKDDVEKALRESWLKLYKTMQDKRSQLMLFPTDDERGVAAHEILDLDEEADRLLAMRDHYRQFGFLPSEQATSLITDPVMAAKRIVLLERYIRRERQAIRENESNFRAVDRLKKYMHEYNLYAERFAKTHIPEQTPEPGQQAKG